MGCSKSCSKRDVFSNTSFLQKTRKISSKNLTSHLNKLEKEEQTKPKVSRRKEKIKIREKINKIETHKTVEELNETKNCFFENINKVDKPLASLKGKRERTQRSKIRTVRRELTTDITEIQKIICQKIGQP